MTRAMTAAHLLALITIAGGPQHVSSFQPFLTPKNYRYNAFLSRTKLGVLNEERTLREEIAQVNNAEIQEEERYSVVDGDSMILLEDDELEESKCVTAEYNEKMQKEISRALKPRAYPLFLLEKAAIFVDGMMGSFRSAPAHSDESSIIKVNGDSKKVNGDSSKVTTKERVVILGTGWGSAAFLKEIDTNKFDVSVVSPRNFFLFTPMLAGASVGTVEYRSITEPVREINPKADFIEATATSVNLNDNKIKCESVVCEGNSCNIEEFEIPYGKLVVAVGAQTNTFGIPGVREYCCFLKQVEDAQRIRTAIVNCFERANLPGVTDDEKTAVLTFAVIGAGPTGVEFASELRDFIEEDAPKYYPNLIQHVRIKIIEASATILAPFDDSLKKAAVEALERRVAIKDPDIVDLLPSQFRFTELLLESGVTEVKKDVILLSNGKEIPYGVAVWAAGNGPLPITLETVDVLGDGEQKDAQSVARGRIAIDPWLRALGGKGNVFAIGDCACYPENQLPATAQVASQQGEFLGQMMNLCNVSAVDEEFGTLLPPIKDLSGREQTLTETITSFATQSSKYAAPFQFLNLGILAYTGGGSALAQLQVAPADSATVKGKGKVGFGLWRSVYLSKQISPRNRVLVAMDWLKTRIFGRDITRV